MCSSPAYPTSAPSGGSTTGHCSPTFRPVSSRSEDVTDFSSKGLLPQLIDVLHALTEGQELLARKVREARLEHYRRTDPVVERDPQTAPSDPLASRIFVDTGPDTSVGIRREQPSGTIDSNAHPTSFDGSANGPRPEPSSGASEAPVGSTVREASSPPPAEYVTDTDTPADVLGEGSAQTDWLDQRPPSEETTAPLNRDYNFFDELDARLADLQDPKDGSGD